MGNPLFIFILSFISITAYSKTYNVTLVRVIDGDTAVFEVDLGFNLKMTDHFRFLNVDTCEMRASDPRERERAKLEKLFVENKMNNAHNIIIESNSRGKYGRWLADIYVDGSYLNAEVEKYHQELEPK